MFHSSPIPSQYDCCPPAYSYPVPVCIISSCVCLHDEHGHDRCITSRTSTDGRLLPDPLSSHQNRVFLGDCWTKLNDTTKLLSTLGVNHELARPLQKPRKRNPILKIYFCAGDTPPRKILKNNKHLSQGQNALPGISFLVAVVYSMATVPQ